MEIEQMGKLVLVRHGESEWNELGKWTGLTDVDITENGIEEAKKMGKLLGDMQFDHIFISKLVRTLETLVFMESTDKSIREVPIEKAE